MGGRGLILIQWGENRGYSQEKLPLHHRDFMYFRINQSMNRAHIGKQVKTIFLLSAFQSSKCSLHSVCGCVCAFFFLVPDCESNHQLLPNETNAAPDWRMPCLPCLLKLFIQTADCPCFKKILHLGTRRQFWNSLLIVQIKSFVQPLDFWALNICYPPVSAVGTLDIVSSPCWWLLFFSLSGRSSMGVFQLLLIYHWLDLCPRVWDCSATL